MKIEYNKELNLFTIENVFGNKISREIMNEILYNKNEFNNSTVGINPIINKNIRDNTNYFADEVYKGKREASKLLTAIDGLFRNENIALMLGSSKYPLSIFSSTNTHETQVSRYGNNEQFYDWHLDTHNGISRLITFVYYPQPEPFKYTGGEIQFSSYPLVNKKPISDEGIITFKPKHDFGVFFPSNTPHRVLKTNSPEIFEDGRFSVNCWIGIR